jgi:hypothetical protein
MNIHKPSGPTRIKKRAGPGAIHAVLHLIELRLSRALRMERRQIPVAAHP